MFKYSGSRSNPLVHPTQIIKPLSLESLRSVQALEDCIEILNTQYSTCELVKLDAVALRSADTPDVERVPFLAIFSYHQRIKGMYLCHSHGLLNDFL